MIKKTMLLIAGVCLVAVVWASANSSIKRKSEFLSVVHEMNVLTNDLVKTMGDAPTIETVGQAHLLFDERSRSLKEKVRILRDSGRFRKDSDERIQFETVNTKNTEKVAGYYERFADLAREDLDGLNDLKDKFISAKSSAESDNLRKKILSKTEVLKANIDVIKAIEGLMVSFETIYLEVEKEEENV